MTMSTVNGRVAKKVQVDAMYTEKVFVTPEMAYDWLVHNTNNRDLRPLDVLYLKQCILSGNWRVTHQGIAFYADGELADGQHRLNAIADAGVGVW